MIGANASKALESVTIGSSLTYTRPTLNAIQDIRVTASPTFVGLTLSGKVTSGSFGSPIDVTNTRKYGFELHYSGNDYDVTGIRSRAQLITTDTTATAQGGLFQAANNNGIDVGVLNGCVIEAIGKSDANAATITMMRGALVGCEWGDYDTVTALHGIHIRIHTRNNAGAGSFGNACALTIENEAVGGNGQALDAGIYFKGTNLSAGNKAFTYGIDFSGGTFATADINLQKGIIHLNGVQQLKVDSTDNFLAGCNSFLNDDGQYNIGVGCETGRYNDTTGGGNNGTRNVYIGFETGCGATTSTNNTGYYNVGIGHQVLKYNTTGYRNVALGYQALRASTSGINNFALGSEALRGNIVGSNNVAIGTQALYTANTFNNIAIGSQTLRYTTGRDNIGIGMMAAFTNAAGAYNIAIGTGSMYYTQSGDENVIIGREAGFGSSGQSYSDNVFIGSKSGYAITTGSQDVFLGYKSGYNQTTVSNIFIIDNKDQGSIAAEITDSLIYGVFSAAANDPASQSLRINAATTVSQTLAVTGNLTMTGNIIIPGDGTIGQATGPLLTFDDTNDYLEISGCNIGVGTTTPICTQGGLDISSGALSLVIGADNLGSSRTDATSKDGRFACTHYTNAEEPVGILLSESNVANNWIAFGGGSGLVNAATVLYFYTATNTTTTTGTIRAEINSTKINLRLPLFIKEQAAAAANVATYGQIWVKNDAPNILMFTDDMGADFIVDVTAV